MFSTGMRFSRGALSLHQSSRRTPGPITTNVNCYKAVWPQRQIATARRMGPGVRRDAPPPATPQPRRNTVDGELDAAQHLFIRILRAMLLQELHLHMVQRIKIGK